MKKYQSDKELLESHKQNILHFLKMEGITVAELSRKSGVADTTLRGILGLQSNNPTLTTIRKIANTLNVSIDELIGSPPPKNKENSGISDLNLAVFQEIVMSLFIAYEDSPLLQKLDVQQKAELSSMIYSNFKNEESISIGDVYSFIKAYNSIKEIKNF